MFDISQEEDYRELTLEEQYLVNGGEQIENSIEAQANASVGDTVTRDDGSQWTLTQGDINWAQKVMGERNGSGGNGGSGNGGYSGGPSGPNPSSPSKAKSPQQQTTGSSRGSKTGYSIDDENKIVSADINDPDAIIEAFSSYYILSDRGYVFEIKDGKNHVHTFSDMKYAANYVKSIDKSKGNFFTAFSEFFNDISLTSFFANKGLQYTIDETEAVIDTLEKAIDISKLSKYSKITSRVSTATGVFGLFCDIGELFQKPTFKNISNVAAGGVALVNVPVSLGGLAVTEVTGELARGCLQVANIYHQKKTVHDNIVGGYCSTPVIGLSQNQKNAIVSDYLNLFNFFFSKD